MKISSKQIQQALEYSKARNVKGLCRALNRHVGVTPLDYDAVRKYVTEGAEGAIAAHIAYEVGLPTPENYVAVYRPKRTQESNKPIFRKTRYRGVHWDRASGQWRSVITVLGKKMWLGSFGVDGEHLAALAYNEEARKLGRKLNEVDLFK